MPAEGAYGDQLGSRFGVRGVPALVSTTLKKTRVAVTLIQSDVAASVMSEPLPVEDAFLVHLNLRACPDHELWIDGRSVGKRTFDRGETAIHDLRRSPAALIHSPMGSLMFYLSRSLLNEICDDSEAPRIDGLHLAPGLAVHDPVVRSLGEALSHTMARAEQASPLFVDHVTMALAVHAASTYGGMRRIDRGRTGGLSFWQEKRAKELLSNAADGDLTLATLARECGLSVGHFAHMFRKTVGLPPYRWLLDQRIERAKSLLRTSRLSLADVAVSCGFFDQSHLTRCFKKLVGVTPGAWRRHHMAG
jgi:AraC-like DNA-binding protein